MRIQWPWQRRRPLGSIDDSLARLHAADTPAKRAAEITHLRDLLAVHYDAAGDAAQRALLAMEDRLSARFSGLVQTQLGVTNDMLSDLKSGIGGLQQQLGEMFSSLGERVDDHDGQIVQLRETVAAHSLEIASFRQSRDASIEERRQHAELLRESAADRKRLTEQIAENEKRYQEIQAQLALLLGRPDAHEAST